MEDLEQEELHEDDRLTLGLSIIEEDEVLSVLTGDTFALIRGIVVEHLTYDAYAMISNDELTDAKIQQIKNKNLACTDVLDLFDKLKDAIIGTKEERYEKAMEAKGEQE